MFASHLRGSPVAPVGRETSNSELGDSQEEDEEEEDVSEDSHFDDKTWVEWFCSLKGHEYFVEVEEEFIKDDFNLTGLSYCPHYERALDVILDNEEDSSGSETDTVSAAAPHVYGLIHARFLLTGRGMQLASTKFTNGVFGSCPNLHCERQNCLPVGTSDTAKVDTCKIYCPKCKEMYIAGENNKLGDLDGAYFGTTFPSLFCMLYPTLMPSATERVIYEPKVFGFRVHRNVKDVIRAVVDTTTCTTNNTTTPPRA